MKHFYFLLLATFSVGQLQAQTFLNGDFENNTAVGDQINLTSPAYDAMMANSQSFGTYGDMDIITSATYSGGPQSGNWFIGFTGGGTDMISMTLSAPLTAGNSYTISFYDKADPRWIANPFEIGLSTSANAFGTLLYTAPSGAANGVWTQRTFTFTAPFSALYITVSLQGSPSTIDWSQADNFTITASTITPPLSIATNTNFATCFGVCNGNATATANGGTPPYHYLWLGTTDTTSFIDSLCGGGLYYVTVTDSLGAAVSDTIALPVVDPFPLNVQSNVSAMCSYDTASVCASSGFVSYHWNTGDTSTCILTQQGGPFFVTVTDANNCTIASNQTSITVYPGPADTVITDQTTICASDTAHLCSTSGFVSYLWNTGDVTDCISATHAGNYFVTVTDNNGCTAASNHLAIHVYPLPPISVSVNGNLLSAFNSVTYQWYFNDTLIAGAIDSLYTATQTGNYSVAVTDANGCHVVSNNVSVTVTGITSTSASGMRVISNPSYKTLQIEADNDWIGANVEVFTAEGRLVFKSEIQNLKSELSLDVAKGVYLLHIYNYQKHSTQRIVKW